MPREFELTGGRIELRGGALAAVGVVALVLLLWPVAFLAGLAPWLGYMDRSIRNVSAGPVTIVGDVSTGIEFGPTDFLFLAGQEVYVDYDVEMRRGALRISVFDYTAFDSIHWETVAYSGSGTASLRIPRTGLYAISIEPTVVGAVGERGYDLDIFAVWGARWP